VKPRGRAAWGVPALLAAYIVVSTRDWTLPLGSAPAYLPAWVGLAALGLAAAIAAARLLRTGEPWPRPLEVAAVLAVTAMLLTDLTMTYQPLRDLGIYLKAGHHFLDGAPVYLLAPMTERPADLTNYPFLYPPLTLPLFALLAALPQWLAQALWVAGSIGLSLTALRLFGLPWRWAIPTLLWPPLFQGLWVGNVAPAALVLFALGPQAGAGLVAGAIFKSYTGIAALWLVRERHWAGIAWGAAVVVGFALLTLPLTGLDAWRAWLEGLAQYGASQPLVPVLYGFGLMKFVPFAVYAALAAVALAAALLPRGREGLARLGTATIVASPSLWGHGLLVAVPSMLTLRSPWLWLAIGATSVPDGLQWWWAIGLIAASWLVPLLRRPVDGAADAAGDDASAEAADGMHPLPAGVGPWPAVGR
jgi:hypothetical protein